MTRTKDTRPLVQKFHDAKVNKKESWAQTFSCKNVDGDEECEITCSCLSSVTGSTLGRLAGSARRHLESCRLTRGMPAEEPHAEEPQPSTSEDVDALFTSLGAYYRKL